MDRYIGLDVHSQSCTMAVVGPSGKRIGVRVVQTSGPELKEAIRNVPGTKHLCLEEGTQSAWLYELLDAETAELVVTVPEKRQGPKDDARDAWQLAEALRAGAIKRRVYKAHGPYSELKAALRSYLILTDDVRRAKNRLKAIYRSRGVQPDDEAYHPSRREKWERQLPLPQRLSARALFDELTALDELWGEAEKRLVAASKAHRIIRTMATAPGIGPIRAAQIVATVITPDRFRTKRQFWAYCGLAIVTRSSADWVRDAHGNWVRAITAQTRGLNANRQPMLKEVFKGAAHTIIHQLPEEPLHQAYLRLTENGTKPNLARLTIARRLAATVLSMWKHQEDYDPKRTLRATHTAQA